MSTQLLSIEAALLSLPQVKAGLNLSEIKKIQRSVTNAQKAKFANTINLSKLVLKAYEWFNSEEAKAIFRDEGVNWSNETFGNKVFGWQKSYFYKVLKAGKLESSVVDLFTAKCDEAEAAGAEPDRSLAGLLKFAKAYEQAQQGSGKQGSEGGGEGEGEGSEAEVETRVATICTLAFKAAEIGAGRNVSVRIDVNGQVNTNNTKEEIELALQFLKAAIAQSEQN